VDDHDFICGNREHAAQRRTAGPGMAPQPVRDVRFMSLTWWAVLDLNQ